TTVVLPAPFGPISAVMAPRAAENDRSSTATRPPKRMERRSTRSTGAGEGAFTTSPGSAFGRTTLPLRGRDKKEGARSSVAFLHERAQDGAALLEKSGGLARADQAARLPDHDQHHGEAEDQHAVLGRIEIIAEDVFEEIELAHDLGAADHRDRRDRDADLAAHAAEHHDREDRCRFQEGEGF